GSWSSGIATSPPDPRPPLRGPSRLLGLALIHRFPTAPWRPGTPSHPMNSWDFMGTPASRGLASVVLSYAFVECAPSGPRRQTPIWRTWPENPDAAEGPAVRSSCWLEHDLMAKKDLQLMDEAADLAMVVHPGDVEVGTEIAETGVRIRKQVPDDDQDGAGHGNQCLELARALDETAVALSQEGVGPGRRRCRLAQDALEVGVASASPGRSALGTGLDGTGRQLGPRHQVAGSGELGHVQAHLGDDRLGGGASDSSDLVQ